MDQDTALWLARVGLALDFLAFWFAAPEILEKDRMTRIEGWLERLVAWLPEIFAGATAFFFFVLILTPSPRPFVLRATAAVIFAACLAGLAWWYVRHRRARGGEALHSVIGEGIEHKAWFRFVVVMLGLAMLGSVAVVAAKTRTRHLAWVVAALFSVACYTGFLLAPVFAGPILRRLAEDKTITRRFAVAGAVLFILGFILQFTATY